MTTRLGRQQWIDTGLRALATQGADAVRVERLAKALAVTKGSFYWHFKDRRALQQAMLDAWQARATGAIIEQVEAASGDALARLRTLFTIVGKADGRLDRAIRNWATQDTMPQRALEQVDQRRMGYLEALFQSLGFSPAQARARAGLVYRSLIGQFTMGAVAPSQARQDENLGIVLPMLVRRP